MNLAAPGLDRAKVARERNGQPAGRQHAVTPRLSKYNSCRKAELAAINSSRLRPLMVKSCCSVPVQRREFARRAFRR